MLRLRLLVVGGARCTGAGVRALNDQVADDDVLGIVDSEMVRVRVPSLSP